MSKTFKFSPEKWMGNRDLRGCSAGARALWVDILCICHANGGYLHSNGLPIDDEKLARMVAESVKSIRAWLKELGEAGIFNVDDRGLYSSMMRKTAKGGVKTARAPSKPRQPREPSTEPRIAPEAVVALAAPVIVQPPMAPAVASPNTAKAKALPWYKTPAGWARKAQEQSVSLMPDEDIEDFKYRVACRIPEGPHLDELAPHYKKMILAEIEKHVAKDSDKPIQR